MTKKHALRRKITVPRRQAGTEPELLGASVRKGALWSVAASIFLRLSNLVTTAVLAHIFGHREFGIFTIAATAFTIVFVVGQFGLTSCLTRTDLDMDSMAPTMLTFSVLTNLVQAGALFGLARPIAAALGSVAAAGPIRVLAIAQIIAGFNEVPNCQLVRDFRQDKLFLAQVAGAVPSTALLLALALAGAGPVAYAWSQDVGLFLSGCVVFASVRRYYRPGLARAALAVLFRFGFPLGMANIVNVVLLNVDYALIGHLIGVVALGSYVLAFNVASWPASALGTMLSWIGVPAFSRVKNDQAALRAAVTASLRALSLVVLPMSVLTIVLSRPLVMVLYGPKWAASVPVLQVLAVYGGASVLCTLGTNVLTALGRSKFLFIVQLAWLGALLPAMMLGVHLHGIYGAAVAHVAVIALLVIPCYLVVLRRSTGTRSVALGLAVCPALIAALIAGCAARLVAMQFSSPAIQLFTGLVVGGLIYVFAVTPQLAELLGRANVASGPIALILRRYNRVARLVGLPGYRSARHARRGSRWPASGRTAAASSPSTPAPPPSQTSTGTRACTPSREGGGAPEGAERTG